MFKNKSGSFNRLGLPGGLLEIGTSQTTNISGRLWSEDIYGGAVGSRNQREPHNSPEN